MGISEKIESLLTEKGITQKWTSMRMNEINPELKMDSSKMSAIITGNRKMTGDELIAFCKALKIAPDVFLND